MKYLRVFMIYEENDETRVDARDEVSADYLVTVHVADMKKALPLSLEARKEIPPNLNPSINKKSSYSHSLRKPFKATVTHTQKIPFSLHFSGLNYAPATSLRFQCHQSFPSCFTFIQ